jgi:hypothetical protein
MTTQIIKTMLNVSNFHDMPELKVQAYDIVEWAVEQKGNVVIMMHEASAEQLADIEALALSKNKPVALIGGQFGLMVNVREQLIREGFIVAEAKTSRVSEEISQPDGSIKKISVFKHEGLRVLN